MSAKRVEMEVRRYRKRVEMEVRSYRNVLPLPLQSCHSWIAVKENLDRKKYSKIAQNDESSYIPASIKTIYEQW